MTIIRLLDQLKARVVWCWPRTPWSSFDSDIIFFKISYKQSPILQCIMCARKNSVITSRNAIQLCYFALDVDVLQKKWLMRVICMCSFSHFHNTMALSSLLTIWRPMDFYHCCSRPIGATTPPRLRCWQCSSRKWKGMGTPIAEGARIEAPRGLGCGEGVSPSPEKKWF